MRRILFLTDRRPDEVLPPVLSLGADVKAEHLDADGLARISDLAPDLIVADAGPDPERAFRVLATLRAAGAPPPVICLLTDPASHAWHEVADEFVVAGAPEAEVRLRLAMLRARSGETGESVVRLGPVALNVDTYRVSTGSMSLDLTYKEFELLRFLATHPGRVYTRAQLLREVWGYDFYGGTRTVDVHVRRLRSKLGPELEHLIETVRGVGYRAADER